MKSMNRAALAVCSVLAIAAVGMGSAPAAHAVAACVVTNTGVKPPTTFNSITSAIAAATDPAATLKLSFTGTCAEAVSLARTGSTTITGRSTRSTGTPTLDATGTDAPALAIASGPVTLKGFVVTGGTGKATGEGRMGGGIHIESTPVTLTDMRVTGNSVSGAGAKGGGIAMSGVVGPVVLGLESRLTIGGRTVIDANTSEEDGGGIFIDRGATVRLLGSARVEKNQAGRSGGGISVRVEGEGGSAALVIGSRSRVAENGAQLNGGGIITAGNADVVIEKLASVRSNTAGSGGGGIALGTGGDLDLRGTISGNTATGEYGGGLSMDGSTMRSTKTARITKNVARRGAGIHATGSSLTIAGSWVSENRATTGAGGGIYLSNPTAFSMKGGRISRNQSLHDGGGLMVDTTAAEVTARLDGVTVSNNRAGYDENGTGVPWVVFGDTTDGGGVSAVSATVVVTGGTRFASNSNFSGNGGGLHAVDSTVTIGRSVFERNGAGYAGGGIHLTRGTLNLSSSIRFARNFAKEDGGAISTKSGVTINESPGTKVTIDANGSGEDGGGVYIGDTDKSIDLFGFTIRNNRAGEDAGGISVYTSSTITLRDSTVTGNQAVNRAGGVSFYAGASMLLERVSITNNKMTGNAVTNSGGGMYIAGTYPTTTAVLNSVRVSGNRTAGAGGGGIYSSRVSLTFGGTTRITGNRTSAGHGGGLYLDRTGPFTLPCSKITGNRNSAERDSDAVYHDDIDANLGDPITKFPCKK